MNEPTIDVVAIDLPEGVNLILGQAHFIKTVEDLYEAPATTPTSSTSRSSTRWRSAPATRSSSSCARASR